MIDLLCTLFCIWFTLYKLRCMYNSDNNEAPVGQSAQEKLTLLTTEYRQQKKKRYDVRDLRFCEFAKTEHYYLRRSSLSSLL